MTTQLQNKFNLAIMEAQQSQLRASYYKQRIAAGAFADKLGKVFHGSLPEHGGTPYTLSEILDSELATMNRHIALAQEHIECAKGYLSDMSNSTGA